MGRWFCAQMWIMDKTAFLVRSDGGRVVLPFSIFVLTCMQFIYRLTSCLIDSFISIIFKFF
uniref:Uncharacterized protein n=1 Tax=Meloidogyne incognita TaxID=6306 RepID=A0A914NBS8_MELIC